MVEYHSELLAKQYWLSCFQAHNPCHHLTTLPAPARNMRGTLMKLNSEVVPLSDEGITDINTYHSCLRALHSQAVIAAKANFVPNSFSTQYPTTWKSAGTVSPYHTCPVAFGSLSALEHLQGCITSGIGRCLSGVWSGSTLRKTSVQLSRPPDATHSA